MLEPEVTNERTILDYLNEDCWHAVLQYVPAQELIRTERASRRWQAVVLMYLRGVHITIEKNDWKKKENPFNTCTLMPSKYKSFECWTKKLGSSVTSIYCINLENLAMIKENCPNLGALQASRIECTESELRQYNLHDNFKLLQQVSFYRCSVGDNTFSQFIADKALEKIEFRYCRFLTGHCFSSINTTNLKSLVLESCNNLQFIRYSVADRLGSLTELKVARVNKEIGYDVQFELEKMAKLERLELQSAIMLFGFPEKVGQLSRLEHLGVSFELESCDLEKVLRGCTALRSLELLDCEYRFGFVEVISRHGGALTSLKLDQVNAKDDDVLELVRGCPKLEKRQESQCPGQYQEMKTTYEGLTVVFEKTINEYDEESEFEDSDEEIEWYEEECEEEEEFEEDVE
ncbi:uncharacterized protein LOC133518488 [Cydia pomonella]|uniref:uncharacterized protein LOC133518488 n=1 Tax=Cydia pomonella TaxID=82600 RepID=UPI002ADDB4B5|nr:uncharacterized protein LOC133518488 [Cydia pomonella]XP_061708189.1 uncharacterized protein LOC133518488 [Cydia pomonella]